MAQPDVPGAPDLDEPLIVVTADSHVGPRLKEDLREYCPQRYLEEYDEFVREYEPHSDPAALLTMLTNIEDVPGGEAVVEKLRANAATAGHYDVRARLVDMDRDGVAAEVVYHGSQNGQCFPLINPVGGTFNAMIFSPVGSAHELELAAVGQRMYNRWLADQCSVEPERHAGLAYLPMWDIDAAVRELEWATSAGLRGVNFPAPKMGIKPYDDPAWERFWSLCAESGMALSTHDGAQIDDLSVHGRHTSLVAQMDELPIRMLPRMIFSGMFERHPNLKFVLTELQQPTSMWWVQTGERYDELWEANRGRLGDQVPRKPSEYLRANVFLGLSLLHAVPWETDIAVQRGYTSNILWGSDYPHQEGVYRHPEDDEEETRTSLGLRNAFSSAPPEMARDMVGENAVRVYQLDRGKLADVARRIGANTLRSLAKPLDTVPEEWAAIARTHVFPEYHRSPA
jgi:predicted TIM-barrel fold metal-dependent hydrolase